MLKQLYYHAMIEIVRYYLVTSEAPTRRRLMFSEDAVKHSIGLHASLTVPASLGLWIESLQSRQMLYC